MAAIVRLSSVCRSGVKREVFFVSLHQFWRLGLQEFRDRVAVSVQQITSFQIAIYQQIYCTDVL